MPITPDEAADVLRRLDQRALEQTAMLMRISGYLNFIQWGVGFGAFMLFLLVLERAH